MRVDCRYTRETGFVFNTTWATPAHQYTGTTLHSTQASRHTHLHAPTPAWQPQRSGDWDNTTHLPTQISQLGQTSKPTNTLSRELYQLAAALGIFVQFHFTAKLESEPKIYFIKCQDSYLHNWLLPKFSQPLWITDE